MLSHVRGLGAHHLAISRLTNRAYNQQVRLELWNNVVTNPFSGTVPLVYDRRDLFGVNPVINGGLNVFIDPFFEVLAAGVNVILVEGLEDINRVGLVNGYNP